MPRASYRVQLHQEFDLDAAAGIVPYLARLGISHLYVSPISMATPGSRHGYDVTDHNRVNPELGGPEALMRLHTALAAHEMGLIVDIVPNHVGVGSDNPWWTHVLRHGQASPFASYFDIDWEAQPHLPRGVLVIPELGGPFGESLEAGEMRLQLGDGLPRVQYGERAWPLAPFSVGTLYAEALPEVDASALNDPASLALAIAAADESRRETSTAEADARLSRLAALTCSETAISAALEAHLVEVSGRVGQSESFDQLERILSEQHYRLADWRVAAEDLNYRRFFDVNSLAAIRVERDDVFSATHQLLFELTRQGIVTGVRVDHVDGLYDPEGYLRRLRGGLDEASGQPGRVPVYVEKILADNEELPTTWATDGTSGYEFGALVDGLFVDEGAERLMTASYQSFTGDRSSFGAVARASRELQTRHAFAGELNVLALHLHRLAQRHRIHRDHTLSSLREAIRAMLVAFPVYRTYVPHADRGRYIREAADAAVRSSMLVSRNALDFLVEVLLLDPPVADDDYQLRLHFDRRFEQVSGPVMAKGVEDTAFYRYNRLLSLNEVGNTPARFGRSVAAAHAWLQARSGTSSNAMLAGSTHDSKRGEDVRARLDVLSELPADWTREVRRWAALNERHRVDLGDGIVAPDRNLEYYLYQTLVGTLPSAGVDAAYVRRISEHMLKAAREAKTFTSWISPDELYERGCQSFIDGILPARGPRPFARRLEAFVRRISAPGALNALSGLVLRALAPGFPDFYQGTELITLSMADPDNRRSVDFAHRACLLGSLSERPPHDLTGDGARIWLTSRLLELRRRKPSLFETSAYVPLDTPGTDHAFAFARVHRQRRVVAVVPRLVSGSVDERGRLEPAVWNESSISLPSGGPWYDELTGARWDGASLRLADILAELPFAVLVDGD